ncbi:MAG: fused response regulator/phosphatase [Pseudomonadota bacterium]
MNSNDNRSLILAVDDIPENLDVIKGALGNEYNLRIAINGESALRAIAEKRPDLILLDIMMPGMDGYEVMRRLRLATDTSDIPVLFVTAMGTETAEIRGLSLGAVDYITKPIVPEVLRARVATHLALLNTRRELETKQRQLQEEKRLIEEIVLRMHDANEFDGRYMRWENASLEVTCGDLVLSAFRSDGTQYVILGDFTGHGLPAAVGGPLVSYAFYTMTRAGKPLADILSTISQILIQRLPVNIFMAAAGLEISPERSHVRLFNMGLPDILVCTGDAWVPYKSNAPPLGIIEFDSYSGCNFALTPDSTIYLLTDGISEATDSNDTMFGQKRLEQSLTACLKYDHPLRSVIADALNHSADNRQSDDMTLVEITALERPIISQQGSGRR